MKNDRLTDERLRWLRDFAANTNGPSVAVDPSEGLNLFDELIDLRQEVERLQEQVKNYKQELERIKYILKKVSGEW